MPGQYKAGLLARPNGSKQICLCFVFVKDTLNRNAKAVEIVRDKIDQRQIRVSANGVEPNESFEKA
jgi:hypothetical protein